MPLNTDFDQVEKMELDLAEKARNAFVSAGMTPHVHGVFSLDDLEKKLENELDSRIAIGVQYIRTAPLEIDFNKEQSASPGQSRAVRMLSFKFLVILAVPTGEACQERYNATKLLTVLRMAIHGSKVAGEAAARFWNFQEEKANLSESTTTMLYYSQVWQVSLPLVSTPASN